MKATQFRRLFMRNCRSQERGFIEQILYTATCMHSLSSRLFSVSIVTRKSALLHLYAIYSAAVKYSLHVAHPYFPEKYQLHKIYRGSCLHSLPQMDTSTGPPAF